MRKTIIMVLILIMGAMGVYGGEIAAKFPDKGTGRSPILDSDTRALIVAPGAMWIEAVTWDDDAISVYYVKAGTESAATFQVNADSFTLTTEDGLYPGTTGVIFSEYATLRLAVARVDTLDNSTDVGLEGDWVITILEGTYRDAPTTDLDDAATLNDVFGIGNITTIDFEAADTDEISLYRPAVVGYKTYILGFRANADVGSGTLTLNMYESNTGLYLPYSMTDEADLRYHSTVPYWVGSANTETEIRIAVSEVISAGGLEIVGYTGR